VTEILLWTLVIAVPAALAALLLQVAGVLPWRRPRKPPD
jgi:hypothetical protein